MSRIHDNDLLRWFTPTALTDEQQARFHLMTTGVLHLARLIVHQTPACAEQRLAVQRLREIVSLLEASLRNEQYGTEPPPHVRRSG